MRVEGEAERGGGAGIGLDLWDRLGLRVTGDIFKHLVGGCLLEPWWRLWPSDEMAAAGASL